MEWRHSVGQVSESYGCSKVLAKGFGCDRMVGNYVVADLFDPIGWDRPQGCFQNLQCDWHRFPCQASPKVGTNVQGKWIMDMSCSKVSCYQIQPLCCRLSSSGKWACGGLEKILQSQIGVQFEPVSQMKKWSAASLGFHSKSFEIWMWINFRKPVRFSGCRCHESSNFTSSTWSTCVCRCGTWPILFRCQWFHGG